MQYTKHTIHAAMLAFLCAFLIISCAKLSRRSDALTIHENAAQAAKNTKEILSQSAIKVDAGLQLSLWATDSLAPDPIALTVDDQGRVYLTRSNRMKNSEFDIRGHVDWMTESISLQSVEERRAFLHKTFAPERSKENEWLKDLNWDGKHDWHDLAVEKEEVWRLEDSDKDGVADVSTRIIHDFHEEITDVAAGILIREHDAFLAVAPDIWRLEDKNGDGFYKKKTSISHGYGVHVGFSGHNLSGIVEGPDGRIYWNIGDIGATVTTADGKKFENPNSGFIARANPDGSDFEIFATGLRNTHEFAFDQYGNLISNDNDGDHPGESERLVHVVEGSDAGWRSNWQYGKYTDPKNNGYNVWMDEKLSVPHWDGQAAYIVPPIMNYHNGPTGFLYNPGTALGSEWVNKFFVVEFVGNPARSPIWAFGLKPQGASFVLDGEKDIVSGILPTGMQFGPDGALYVGDWINGWNAKDYGRVWKLDVAPEKNDLKALRAETQRLMQINYAKQTPEMLYSLLGNADLRIRKKAQFELVNRGAKGKPFLEKAIAQRENQLARIHGIWGVGQLARKNQTDAQPLIPLLKDSDPEIIVQAIKMLGDAEVKSVGETLIALLTHPSARIRFFAAEALGQLAYAPAVEPLLNLLKANNDADLYIRHAGVLALTRIGKTAPITALANHPSKALRTAAVLVLRRLKSEQVAIFLNDKDEYIATEAARAINDDLSIPAALPALAQVLTKPNITSEPLLRRAINAALRVGSNTELDQLIAFATRTDLSDAIKAEALAALGTWAAPSLTDRVDGRYRGKVTRDPAVLLSKIRPHVGNLLKAEKTATLVAVAGMLANLNMTEANDQLAALYAKTQEPTVKIGILAALNQLKYAQMQNLIKNAMLDADENVRATALGLLNDSNVTKESLPTIVNTIFGKGSVKEQQQMLVVLGKLSSDKTVAILENLLAQKRDNKLSPALNLELAEAIEGSGDANLKAQFAALKPSKSVLDDFMDALDGGNIDAGQGIFYWNGAAQCSRCHAIGKEGGIVGPSLDRIGRDLTKVQILQALVEPSTRIAPGYGNVSLRLKGGQTVYGVLTKETSESLTLATSDAEPMVVPLSRIEKRDNLPSSMPEMGAVLSKREIRDLVAFLESMKE